ncbi:MAG: DUF2537 domain-containing protein [Pseudonocardia sp.]
MTTGTPEPTPWATGTPEPTPWATGLTAAAMVAALAMAIDLLVSLALRAAYGWWWIPANVLLGIGLAPLIWVMRKVPFWRWIANGVAVGFGLAWVGLAVSVVFGVRNGG